MHTLLTRFGDSAELNRRRALGSSPRCYSLTAAVRYACSRRGGRPQILFATDRSAAAAIESRIQDRWSFRSQIFLNLIVWAVVSSRPRTSSCDPPLLSKSYHYILLILGSPCPTRGRLVTEHDSAGLWGFYIQEQYVHEKDWGIRHHRDSGVNSEPLALSISAAASALWPANWKP